LLRATVVRWWTRRALAIDVGPSGVRLVVMRPVRPRPQVDAVARAALPPDAMHGHAVRQADAVGAVIRRALREIGWRRGPVATAVPAPAVMVRRLALEAAAGSHLDALVVRHVAAHLPVPLEQTVLDYDVAGTATGGSDRPQAQVRAVAVRRDLVQSYTAALRAAALEPSFVDVDLFAVERIRRVPGTAVLVHVRAHSATIAVLASDGPHVAGDVPAGPDIQPDALARAVARSLELLPSGVVPPHPLVLLSGDAAAAADVTAAFSSEMGLRVEVVDPFAEVVVASRLDSAILQTDAPGFAVAVGLALRCLEAAR
jgi:type IV pilus assembly protein PilM